MSNNSELNQSNSQREQKSSLPTHSHREYVAVRDGEALNQLENWIEKQLGELLDRQSQFESPSSCKKYFSR